MTEQWAQSVLGTLGDNLHAAILWHHQNRADARDSGPDGKPDHISQPDCKCKVAGKQKDDRALRLAEVRRIDYERQNGEERWQNAGDGDADEVAGNRALLPVEEHVSASAAVAGTR